MEVLLLETIAPEAAGMLYAGATVHLSGTPESGAAVARKYNIHAIVTRGKGDVSQELIDLCPELKVIARCGVGLDNIDVKYASSRGIRVVNAPGANADTVAEHTLGLMLSLQRRIFVSVQAVKAGNWAYRNTYDGDELRGKTLGILGYGNIGQRVETLARAFGMKTVHLARNEHTNRPGSQVQREEQRSKGMDLESVLSHADILSIHLPLTPQTRSLLNAASLAKCKSGTLIVNTARGEVVEEEALFAALKTGHLGGYSADVLSIEPPAPESPLLALPNVLITPHAASLTARTYKHICSLTVGNTLRVLNGEPIDPRYIANRADLPNILFS